jgi:hypothetical protein
LLEDNSSVLDVIRVADEEIKNKVEKFPVEEYKSLLSMVYHPCENRFYKQVAVQAYMTSNSFISLRENIRILLPNEVTIILVPERGCTTDWEKPVE